MRKSNRPRPSTLSFSSEMSDHYWRDIVMSATALKPNVLKQTSCLIAERLTYGVVIQEQQLFRATHAAACSSKLFITIHMKCHRRASWATRPLRRSPAGSISALPGQTNLPLPRSLCRNSIWKTEKPVSGYGSQCKLLKCHPFTMLNG